MLWNNGQTSTSELVEIKLKHYVLFLHSCAMYATPVPCEKNCSTAGQIVSKKRSYLLTDCFSKLVSLSDNLQLLTF